MGLINTLWCLQFPFQLLCSASCFLLSTGAAGFKSYLKWHFQQVLCPECWNAFVLLVPYPLCETKLVFCNTSVRLVCLILLWVHLWELRTVATTTVYFLKFFKFMCFNFWLCWVFVATLRLSLVAAVGGYSLAVAHWLLLAVVSLCGGFLLRWFLLLQSMDPRACRLQWLQHMGLAAQRHVGSFQPGLNLCPPRWQVDS